MTGAPGFVGKQVLKSLESSNIQITLILRSTHKDFYINNKSIKSVIYTDNVFDEKPIWWEEACKNIDIFINLAWYAEPGKYLDSPLNTDCYNGTVSMIKGASKAGIKKFVGGAGIVAAHAAGLGAKVKLISVGGNDDALKFSQQSLESFSVEAKNNVRKNLLNLMFYIFMNDASNFH
ncbi:NAD-dependent epimerase/dehydratase family protein [Gammaproteobacteria bacterium]|nr:NAD-dependent epimerase/dehydratase family protein [Gammaproteobacteria bacterium]